MLSEEKIRLIEQGMEVFLELGRMTEASLEEVADFVLERAKELTGSTAGFINLAGEDGKTFRGYAYSRHVMQECSVAERPLEFPVERAGLWAEAARRRKPVVINDYETTPDKKGLPEGHIPLKRLVCIPVIDGGKVVAIGAFANKDSDYDEADLRQLSLLLVGMWQHVKWKRLEETLRQSEAGLVEAQRLAHIGSWELDFLTNKLKWSEEIYRIFGMEPGKSDISYKTFLEAVHPDDREFVNNAYTASVKEKKPYNIVHRLLMKDGTVKYVNEKCETFYDRDGRPLRSVGTVQDITERKATEEKLEEALRVAEEEKSVSAALLDLATSVGGLVETNTIAFEVLKATLRLTASTGAAIFIGDKEGSYRVVAYEGWPEHLKPAIQALSLGRGDMPAVDMLLDGKDVIIDDASKSEKISRELVKTFGLEAVLMTPLVTGHGVIGAIIAGRQRPFSLRESKLIRGIASVASTAFENSSFYRESIETTADLARKIETIKSTTEIDRSILSTLDRNEIMETVKRNIQRIVPSEKISLVRADEEGRGYYFDSELIAYGTCPLVDSVIKTGRVLSIPDLSVHKQTAVLKDFYREGFGSLIVLPLHAKGNQMGCVILAGKRVAAFDKEDISNSERLAAQMAVALYNAKLFEDMGELFLSMIKVLVNAVDAKSPWTKGHSERVTAYAVQTAVEMVLDEKQIRTLEVAGLLHDIGKIGTSDYLLDKPGRLTEEEFALVKQHPVKGAEILRPIAKLKDVIPAVRHHHERLDGTGYPDGLKGMEIPLLARILFVADSFDAMTADRPYRPAPGRDFALSELRRCSGTQFDPDAAAAFFRVVQKMRIPERPAQAAG